MYEVAEVEGRPVDEVEAEVEEVIQWASTPTARRPTELPGGEGATRSVRPRARRGFCMPGLMVSSGGTASEGRSFREERHVRGRARGSAWYLKLHWQVVIALLGGVAFGTFAPGAAHAIGFIGDLFLRLLKMVIIPLIFTSLVSGVASLGDARSVGRIGVRTLSLFSTRSPPPWRSRWGWRW